MTNAPTPLQLQIHSPDDSQGKSLEINGCPYEIVQLLASGHQAAVHKLRNCRTALSEFVLKIFRVRHDSPEYEAFKREAVESSFVLGAMSAEGQVDFAVAPLEIYEQNGGLLGFQRFVQSRDDMPTDLRALNDKTDARLAEARELRERQEYAEALGIYDGLLAVNPNHTRVLKVKSLCLWKAGDRAAAHRILLRAIELEPNDTSLYHQLSAYFGAVERYQDALEALVWTLSRYPVDFPSWSQMADLTTTLDLTDDVAALLDRGLSILGGTGKWAGLIHDSRQRTAAYEEALAPVAALQESSQWQEALGHCERAMGLAKTDVMARLNAAICDFHLGDLRHVMENVPPMVQELRGPRALAALALLLVSAAQCENWESAKVMAEAIRSRAGNNPFDLPTIPIAVWAAGVREQADVTAMVSVLRQLPTRVDMSLPERAQMQTLAELYVRRASKTGDLPVETQSPAAP